MAVGDKSMSGKQAVEGVFNLDAFVEGAEIPNEKQAVPRKPKKERARKSKIEHVTERIQVKLTVSEANCLKEKAGLVPISAFVRNFLKDNKLI